MIYRIDRQHFLTHAIDYFTLEELTHMQFAILSGAVMNGGRYDNVSKINHLYPEPDIIADYHDHQNLNVFEKQYFDFLNPSEEDKEKMRKGGSYFMYNKIYSTFINPLMLHHDIVIICDESENYIVDAFCKYLKKKFYLEVIDLNQLFKTGHVGSIYIDRDQIKELVVDIRKQAARDEYNAMASTVDGRAKLISQMSKKDKLRKLKSLEIDLHEDDMKNLDSILFEAWNEEMAEED